jgi:2'-5' RNA ligase
VNPGGAGTRCFVAIDLPASGRAALAAHLDACRARAPGYRWVPHENLHLTLRFAGHLDRPSLDRLIASLTVVNAARFRVGLGGSGTFGSPRAPRVVWLSVEEGRERLVELAALVEAACRDAGLDPEPRPVSPHLTLARARPTSPPLGELAPPPTVAPWVVDDFVLFESVSRGRRNEYVPLRRYPLA